MFKHVKNLMHVVYSTFRPNLTRFSCVCFRRSEPISERWWRNEGAGTSQWLGKYQSLILFYCWLVIVAAFLPIFSQGRPCCFCGNLFCRTLRADGAQSHAAPKTLPKAASGDKSYITRRHTHTHQHNNRTIAHSIFIKQVLQKRRDTAGKLADKI
jgi:hypothetical protein